MSLAIQPIEGLTFVYVAVTETPGGVKPHVKVGITANPRSRLASLQTGSPHGISFAQLLAFTDRNSAARLEKEFHKTNADVQLSGEWFDMYFTEAYESLASCFQRLALPNVEWELP